MIKYPVTCGKDWFNSDIILVSDSSGERLAECELNSVALTIVKALNAMDEFPYPDIAEIRYGYLDQVVDAIKSWHKAYINNGLMELD